MPDTLTLRLLRFLPRNVISRVFGWLASWQRPRFVIRFAMRWFVRTFGLEMSEASRPLEEYGSLLSLFTRELREGAREIESGKDILVSPVDGCVGASGRIESGTLYQAKGMAYSAASLLGSKDLAERFEGGSFVTLYLSPRDYHRIHVPLEGEVVQTLYEPGTLWPVNPPAIRTIPNLFAVNERVTSLMSTDQGEVAVVMVGATNVGRIRLAYDELVTNASGTRRSLSHEPGVRLSRGGHLGTFELGSTVVLLVSSPNFGWRDHDEGEWIPMGSRLGLFASSPS